MTTQGIPLTGDQVHAAGAAAVPTGHFTPEEIETLVTDALSGDEETGSAAGGKEGTEGPPSPATGSPPPAAGQLGADDPVYEIPGVGQVKASQVRGLLAQRSAYESVRSERERIEADKTALLQGRQEVEEAAHLRKLLDFKPFRDKVQQALSEFVGSPELSGTTPDGRGSEILQALRGPKDEELASLKSKLAHVEEFVSQVEEREALGQVNQVLEDYAKRYPEIITEEFKVRAIDGALETYSDRADFFRVSDFKSYVGNMIQEVGMETIVEKAKAEALGTLANKPSGARVVRGNSTRTSAKPQLTDPRKMDWKDLQAEIAKGIGSE